MYAAAAAGKSVLAFLVPFPFLSCMCLLVCMYPLWTLRFKRRDAMRDATTLGPIRAAAGDSVLCFLGIAQLPIALMWLLWDCWLAFCVILLAHPTALLEWVADELRSQPLVRARAEVLVDRGLILRQQGRHAEAEQLYREALELCRETFGDRHPNTLICIVHLGLLLRNQGKYGEAEPLHRELVQAKRKTLGGRHPDTLAWIHDLGFVLKGQGKYDEAARRFREAFVRNRQVQGDSHPHTRNAFNNLSMVRSLHAGVGVLIHPATVYAGATVRGVRVMNPP